MESRRRLFPLDGLAVVDTQVEWCRRGYLMPYRGNTRDAYDLDLRLWFERLGDWGIPVLAARRVDIESFDAEMEAAGLKPSTRQRRLIAICGFYEYCEHSTYILAAFIGGF